MISKKGYVLVTGGSGFIGSHLVNKLVKRKFKVAVITRQKTVPPSLKKLSKKIKLIHCDIKNISKVKIKIDYVFHLAANTPHTLTNYSRKHMKEDIENAKIIAEFVKKVKKIVFLSGHVVYGIPKKVSIDETDPKKPIVDYGKNKLKIENYFLKHLNKILIIIRASSVYGPGQKSKGVIPSFIKAALSDKEMVVYGKDVSRDYVFVDDLCNSLILSLNKKSGIYNIGGGKSYKILAIAKKIKKLIGKGKIIIKAKNTKIINNQLSIKHAQKVLNYKPKTVFEEGLKKQIEWNKERKKSIFFDLDGSILDVWNRLYFLYKDLMVELDQKVIPKKDYIDLKKNKINEKEIVRRTCENKEIIKKYFTKRNKLIEDKKYLKHDKLVPNFVKTILKLKKKNYIILTTFRKNKSNLLDQLIKLRIKKFFDDIIVVKGGLLKSKFIKKNRFFDRENSIVIGDTGDDILTAKQLFVPIIAVTYGVRSEKILKSKKPDYMVNEISDILKYTSGHFR